MANNTSAMSQRIAQAALGLKIKSDKNSLAARIVNHVNQHLENWKAVSVSHRGRGNLGLESLGLGEIERSSSFDPIRDADPSSFMQGLKDLGLADRHIVPVTEQCFALFDEGYDMDKILRFEGDNPSSYIPLSQIVGRSSVSMFSRDTADGIGFEAFGDDINRLNSDDRLTMDLTIMRPWENIMDKGLARTPESSPVVTIRIPNPQAWDWNATQAQNSTVYSRNFNNYRLRDLYRNPTPVNSAPKQIVPIAANDVNDVLWGGGTQYYKTNVQVSTLDLSKDSATINGDQIDRTDLVADGGILDGVIVTITNPNGGSPKVESFALSTATFALARFTLSPSNNSSGQRQVIFDCALPITSASTQYNGAASTIAAGLTDADIVVRIRVTATLDLQTGLLQGGGSANPELVQKTTAPISAATQTFFGTLTNPTLAAYSVHIEFDEENQRKANLAVWVQYSEKQFVVPRSRVFFTQYSLSQEVDENAVAATASIVALGNGRRGLDIIVNALNDVAAGEQYALSSPAVAQYNDLDEQSFAASLVKPTVVTTTLDFTTEEVNTMNESTRLSEMHGRFRARVLEMASTLMANSLMLNQYKGGEMPVFKCWVHSTIADIVIGILDYHPDLKDQKTTATGADFTMVLPNGYRLDIIKSNFDCLKQRIYMVPVIESDMGSVLSAASIKDCGTVTLNYSPTNAGSVVRRVATTTREIVMVSNPVGMCLEVLGLEQQLGAIGVAPIALNADNVASMDV